MFQMTRREQLGAIILVVLLLLGLLLRYLLLPKPVALEVLPPPETPLDEEQPQAEIVVHIAGAVRTPGVYTLPAGARVYMALEAAGGVLPEADEHALNLAEPLFDGRRITVPFQGEQGAAAAASDNDKVNINTAQAAEFEQLPGIGPAKAAAIIAYREENGPFQSVDDLTRVSGIGINTLNVIKDYLTLY
ncbi:MAG TPA: helix-hairpin-helix domain-containing protein [Oscillospiraceae bacterium]|nr:helix-hairpin-helix domain-containing protein [Oscillospiraceae bacterium]